MKAAVTAGLTLLVLAVPAFAQTTIQTTQSSVTTTTSAPAVIQTAPATVIQTREITLGATYPAGIIHVVPAPVSAYAADYLCPSVDYSQDFIWEAFGPNTDLAPGEFVGGGE